MIVTDAKCEAVVDSSFSIRISAKRSSTVCSPLFIDLVHSVLSLPNALSDKKDSPKRCVLVTVSPSAAYHANASMLSHANQ